MRPPDVWLGLRCGCRMKGEGPTHRRGAEAEGLGGEPGCCELLCREVSKPLPLPCPL